MDVFAPTLLDLGLGGMIGKGEMCEEVTKALVRNTAVYFSAIGGAGALYGKAIKTSECIAFPDLLSEAVYKLEVENFPVVVATDCHGKTIY
jgi:fumarate hydratase subunit beta